MKELSDKKRWEVFYKDKNLNIFSLINSVVNNFFKKELKKVFEDFIPHQGGLSLIELGCGNSDWLPYFCSKYRYEVYGVEYLNHACQLAEQKLKLNGCKSYQVYCGDFFELHKTIHFKFNILVSFGVVEHFDNLEYVIKISSYYLNKGGFIITVCPNTKGLAMSLQKYIDYKIYKSHKLFDLEYLIKCHKTNGYKIIFADYIEYESLNNLDFSNYGKIGKIVKMIIKLWNLPFVYTMFKLKKCFQLPLKNQLSATMVVIAQKL